MDFVNGSYKGVGVEFGDAVFTPPSKGRINLQFRLVPISLVQRSAETVALAVSAVDFGADR
jgi:hypothetical protein